MILPGINVLIPALDSSDRDHAKAKRWLEGLFKNREQVAIADVVQAGVIRVSSNPNYKDNSIPTTAGLDFFEPMFRAGAVPVSPGPRFRDYLRRTLDDGGMRGAEVSDAHIAAIALEHGCVVATRDRDFRRFSLIESFDPFSAVDSE